MRRLLSLLALGLVACQGIPTDAPRRDDAQPVLAAATSTSNTIVPFAIGVFVPCALDGAGEVVVASGDLHILVHQTVSNAGNMTLKTHFQPQGVSGTGQTSGMRYNATGVTQTVQTINGNPPWNYTYVNNFRFIGQGPGNNYMVHNTYHVTVNANGEVTANHQNSSVTCE